MKTILSLAALLALSSAARAQERERRLEDLERRFEESMRRLRERLDRELPRRFDFDLDRLEGLKELLPKLRRHGKEFRFELRKRFPERERDEEDEKKDRRLKKRLSEEYC